MAVRRGGRDVFFEMNAGSVLEAMQESDKFVSAIADGQVLGELNQSVYNVIVQGFAKFVDDHARMSSHADTRGLGDFHHLYETGHVGEASARLFRFAIPQESRQRGASSLIGRFTFKEAEVPGWAMGVVGDEQGESKVYAADVPAFRRKAEVFEMGEPIALKRGTRFYMRAKPNYRGEVGSLPYVVNNVQLNTKTFETYHRLHEEFAAYIMSGVTDVLVKGRMQVMDRVVMPDVIRRLEARIKRNNAKYLIGTGPNRELNYRVFRKTVASHVSNEYTRMLSDRLRTLGGPDMHVIGEQ